MIVIQQTPQVSICSGEVLGKDMREALDSLLICGNKIDPEGPGKLLFVTLGYANLTLLCVYYYSVSALLGSFSFWHGTDLNSL